MNWGMPSILTASSPNTARDVREFVAVFTGRRRGRYTVSLPVYIVVMNNTTF